MQYGGGARKRSFGDLFDAFFSPTRVPTTSATILSGDDQFGDQVAALTSKFVFPARVPVSVYFEYAGEDGSRGEAGGWAACRCRRTSIFLGLETFLI